MIHACLCTICFVFCYTSRRFYAFSGTNLLTRCHSASSLFSVVFVFQKSYTRNILGIGRNKAGTSYFSRTQDEYRKRARGGAREQPHQGVACPPPGRARGWCGPPGCPLTPPFRLFKASRSQNPRSISVFHTKVPQRRHRRRPILGDRTLYFGTLLGRGSAPGAVSIDSNAFTAISINIAFSHDEEGVVLPRG
jgi:hypothetical protein